MTSSITDFRVNIFEARIDSEPWLQQFGITWRKLTMKALTLCWQPSGTMTRPVSAKPFGLCMGLHIVAGWCRSGDSQLWPVSQIQVPPIFVNSFTCPFILSIVCGCFCTINAQWCIRDWKTYKTKNIYFLAIERKKFAVPGSRTEIVKVWFLYHHQHHLRTCLKCTL